MVSLVIVVFDGRLDEDQQRAYLDLWFKAVYGKEGVETAESEAEALWSAGDLAIAGRRHFHRTFDLTERVVYATLGHACRGEWVTARP